MRGRMRYRKACATYPNKMRLIRKNLRGKFPALRQAKGDWLVNRILRNVLHNSMPRTTKSIRSPPESSEDAFLRDQKPHGEYSEDVSEKDQEEHEGQVEDEEYYEEENWLNENCPPK